MKTIIKAILGLGIAVSAIALFNQSSRAEQKFSCDEEQLSTSVQSHRGEFPIILWSNNNRLLAPPHTPVERCRKVSARFSTFHNNGTLKYMSTGTMNSYPVICVAEYVGGDCLSEGLLITLKQGIDPNVALKRILDFRVLPIPEPIKLNNVIHESNDGLVSEINDKVYVDVERWLDEINDWFLK